MLTRPNEVRSRRRFSGAVGWMVLLTALSVEAADVAPARTIERPGSESVGVADAAARVDLRSASHALLFRPDAMLVAGHDHLLKVGFVGARPTAPQACPSSRCSTQSTASNAASEPDEIRYQALWPGIDLHYDTAQGIVRSTYYIAPGARASDIRLAYNVDFVVNASGSLMFRLGSGTLTESAPIAWQEIDGRRVQVPVSFEVLPGKHLGFRVGDHDPGMPLIIDPTLYWNSFLGGSGGDYGVAVAAEIAGGVYVVGTSDASWGAPGVVRAHSGGDDAFVALLSTTTGQLVWYTFLGGSGIESGTGVAIDSSGRLVVTGSGDSDWSAVQPNPAPPPVRPRSGQMDAFVARLDAATGFVLWLTYLGSGSFDYGQGIANDGLGNLYVTGYSPASWPPDPEPAPLRAYSGADDAFVAKLSVTTGVMAWNTFLGSATSDFGSGIVTDSSGNVVVTGRSDATWGSSPVRGYSGNFDAFVARLSPAGEIAWHTFLGGTSFDGSSAVAVDQAGAVYISGSSLGSWGLPSVRPFAGGREAFVARLEGANGVLSWHTFLGSPGSDFGYGVASDPIGRIYVTGRSPGTWGAPIRPISGGGDGFVALLDASDGVLLSNTFLGGEGADESNAVSCDGSGQAFVVGISDFTWGTPVRPHTANASNDAFVARLWLDPMVFADGFE
jgi:hypothetical protein